MEVTILDNLGISADLLLRSLSSLFIAILFIQSGVDKVVNWKGEKEFYTSHFKKSILKGTVPILMPVITISELAAAENPATHNQTGRNSNRGVLRPECLVPNTSGEQSNLDLDQIILKVAATFLK